MKLQAIDTGTFEIRASMADLPARSVLARLSSIAMVASDCGLPAISFEPPVDLPPRVASAMREFVRRNPGMHFREAGPEPAAEFGFFVVGRSPGFLCLREAHSDAKYSIFVAAMEENVDFVSRCAYVIANVLGFSSLLSFEVRFSVYELLNNLVEHGLDEATRDWVQLDLERREDRLAISITDRGIPFDPTGSPEFDLGAYLDAGRRRGLGLIMTRKIADRLDYRRESGYNKVIFEKAHSTVLTDSLSGKEKDMAQFEVTAPKALNDGSLLFALAGDLDTKGALVMENLMCSILEKRQLRVVLDFEKVPFISSAGVGILLGLVSAVRDEGGEVTFVQLSQKVRSVFRLLNLEDYFAIRDSAGTVA